MEYEEKRGWYEYFRRRPKGWQEDNRAFIVSQSFGGGKMKPEDLFPSLGVIQSENKKHASVGEKFFERFSGKMTEQAALKGLKDD